MPLILKIHGDNPERRHIQHAREALNRGQIVLLPTETGYCFVGDPNSEKVFKRFLDLRQAHPKQKPFSLLCRDLSQVAEVASFNTPVFRVAKKALPGPYTILLNANRNTPKYAGSQKKDSVGIRISEDTVAASVAAAYEAPLLITSVTDSEELDSEHYYDDDAEEQTQNAWWTNAEDICEHHKGKVDVALCVDRPVQMHASTIVDFTTEPPLLVRDGGWPLDVFGFLQATED